MSITFAPLYTKSKQLHSKRNKAKVVNLLQEILKYFKKKDFHVLLYEAHTNTCQDASFMELRNKHSAVHHHFPVVKRL